MAEGRAENVFDLLEPVDDEEKIDDDNESNDESPIDHGKDNEIEIQKNLTIDTSPVVPTAGEPTDEENMRESAWTDVPSTKTRKTAIPVASLFKQDMSGNDRNVRGSPAAPPVALAPQSGDAQKKKVLRFTRDELLALHRPTKCLPEMSDITEITSLQSLEPECRNTVDTEEILKIWNSDPNKQKEGGGRGRGRGRGKSGEDDGNYSGHHKDDDNQDMWDDIDSASSKTFDLADFSAAAFKFSESSIKLNEATALYSKEGDDAMEGLFQDEDHKKPSEETKVGNERGRSLLLQTLSVKAPEESKAAPAPSTPFKVTVQASTDDTLLDELIEEDVVIAPVVDLDNNDDSLTFDAADDLDLDSIIGGLTAAPLPSLPIVKEIPVHPSSVNPTPFLQPMQQPHQQPQAQVHSSALYSLGAQQMPRPQMPSPSRPTPQPQFATMLPPQPAPAPAPAPMPDKWIYRDPHGNTQGPFEMNAMRRWLESGYFKENLPIKMTRWNAFHPLGVVYPNPESAFLCLVLEPMMQPSSHIMQPIVPSQPMAPVASQSSNSQQSVQLPASAPRAPPAPAPAAVDTSKPTEQRQEANSQEGASEDQTKGKRAIPKSAAPLVVTAPLEQATVDSSSSAAAAAATTASKSSSKKSKESQPKEASNAESSKGKQGSKSNDSSATPPQQGAAAVAKDANSANKKNKSTKKSSKDDESSLNKKNDDSSAAATAAAASATPWANKKGRDGNEAKALKLTEIQQQEEAAKKQSGGDHHSNESPPSSVRSFQLKNLLGVGGKEKGWSANSGNQAPSLRDIQVEQEKISQEAASQRPVASGPPASAPQQQQPTLTQSQWKAPTGQAKPFTAILEEEKLASGTSQEVKAPKGGSWAAKAGGSKALETGIPAAWVAGQSQKSDNGNGNLDPTPASAAAVTAAAGKSGKRVTTQSTSPVSTSQQSSKKASTAANAQSATTAAASAPAASATAPQLPSSGGDTIVDWSVQQLKRLTSDNKSSTDDLALIEFCLTLKSAVEIREYLADYLGSTPQVSQFATEFIRRKEGKQPTQLRSTAGGTSLNSSSLLEKDKKVATLPTETKKKKQRGKGIET